MQLIIRLNKDNAVPIEPIYETLVDEDGIETVREIPQYRWEEAMQAAALEVQALNAYSGTADFPLPIPCNPAAMEYVEATEDEEGNVIEAHWQGNIEGFLGSVNTPPTAERGMVTVCIAEYAWLDMSLFPALPMTFSFVFGDAPVGTIV